MKLGGLMPALLAATLAVGAAGLCAQGALEYPSFRVRMQRTDKMAVQPYYVDNRVVFKRISLDLAGEGVRITGEIMVDFDCDRAPAEEKLPAGPIMDLRVDVQLFEITPVLTRNRQGQIDDVRIDLRSQGRPVEGQAAQCRTRGVENAPNARLATAMFELPALPRPLAPGIYTLAASLNFLSQGAQQLNQIKWCSDFWGAEDQGIDPLTQERKIFPIIGDKARHEQFFKEVTDVQRKVEGTARLYMGNVLTPNGPVLRPPFNASDRAPANFVFWDQLAERVTAIEELEGHEEAADKDLADMKTNTVRQAAQLKVLQQVNPAATVANLIQHWEEQTKILKENARANLLSLGGKTDAKERSYRVSVLAARMNLLEQIKTFQDRLIERYWTLLDGYIYYGYHTINRPGAAIYEAVKNNDQGIDAKKRDDELAKPEKANEETYVSGLRNGPFKAQSAEIWKQAETYWRKWPYKTVMLSRNFTRKEGDQVFMDAAKWDVYRDAFIDQFLKDTDKVIEELDTSIRYANSTWANFLAEARAARDEVVCMGFAYEYFVRTETEVAKEKDEAARANLQKEQIRVVLEEWKVKETNAPERNLGRYMLMSQKSPMAIHTQHRQRLLTIRNGIKIDDFAKRYKDALEKGEILPGSKKQ